MEQDREKLNDLRQEAIEQGYDCLPVGIMIVGPEGLILKINRRLEEYLGITVEETVGRSLFEMKWIEAAATNSEFSFTFPFDDQSAGTRHIKAAISPYEIEGQRYCSIIFKDVSREIETAWIDGLTEIYNRRGLEEEGGRLFSESVRYNSSLAIVFLDMDNLKQINDQFGHFAGDRALINLARVLKDRVRKSDIVGRWGGDEFIVILPRENLTGAEKFANYLNERIEAESFVHEGRELKVRVSLGVSALRKSDESFQKIVERADKRMYQQKQEKKKKTA